MTLGSVIRDKRVEIGMNQEELAKELNTTKATVSRLESNQISNLKRSMIAAICKALDLDPYYFFQKNEVISPDEDKLLRAYRIASPSTKEAIYKLLDIKGGNLNATPQETAP